MQSILFTSYGDISQRHTRTSTSTTILVTTYATKTSTNSEVSYSVGVLGVGKTVLSSILTRHLPSTSQQARPLVLSIYLDYNSKNVQTLPHLIGSLLKQLIQNDELYVISDDLRNVYRKAKRLQLDPVSYFDDIRKILVVDLGLYDRFYIVVDGFDELPARDRVTLQRELLKLQPNKGSLVVTMRPINRQAANGTYECDRCRKKDLAMAFRCRVCEQGNYDLCYECKYKGLWCLDRSHQLTEPYGCIEVSVEIPHTDIERFVRREIGIEIGDAKPLLRDDRDNRVTETANTTPFQDMCQSALGLPEQIVTEVTKKADGRFLYAKLCMESLRAKSNLLDLKRALRRLPDSVEGYYREAMQRIGAQPTEDRERGYKVLGLVSHARRPLSLKELQHALAVTRFNDDEDCEETFFDDAIDQAKTILDSTSALVILENDGTEVQLVHRSLEDYLHQDENCKMWFPTADVDIAKACMAYLHLVLPREPCNDESIVSKNSKFPFLQYASQYWGDHVRDAFSNTEDSAGVLKAVMELINDTQRKDACMQAAWLAKKGGHDTWDVHRNVNRLHICAWYGLSTVLSALNPDHGLVDVVEHKYDQTPLMYACRKGHVEVARQLLRLGASQRKVSNRGRTALFEAILGQYSGGNAKVAKKASKHNEIVELLVMEMPGDLDINLVNSKERNRTALMTTARLGHFDMVEILLRHEGTDVDLQDDNGMTALYLAAREDHHQIAQLLLDAEASIDVVDYHAGRSPLRCAAERDHVETVGLLLEYGADPALKDREGGTAMLRAVNRGAKSALMKMMEHSIDMECVDDDGQSLLHGAARNGYHDIARLLMEDHLPEERSPDVKALGPNLRDKYGLTPLHDASQRGELAVAAVLLEKGADASLGDKLDRTPFMVAWQYGHDNIMRMLAATGHGQPSGVGLDEKQLPIWAMTRRGLTELVAEAFGTRKQDLHITEPCTQNSALHCAVEANEPDILRMLLETNMIPVNKDNHWARTPLHIAALEGDLDATKFLIDHGANLDTRDRWNDEALFLAQSNHNLEVMLALIDAGADVDEKKINTTELFFFAVEQRKAASAQILLHQHGVDRSVQNADGVRAMQIAEAADDKDMIRVLSSAPTARGLEDGSMRFIPFRSRRIQL